MTIKIKNEQLILKLNHSEKNEECAVYVLEYNEYYYFLAYTMKKERYFKIKADRYSMKNFEFYHGVVLFDESYHLEIFSAINRELSNKRYLKVKYQESLLSKFNICTTPSKYTITEEYAQMPAFRFVLSIDDVESYYNAQIVPTSKDDIYYLCIYKGNIYYRMAKYQLRKIQDILVIDNYEYYHRDFKLCRLASVLSSHRDSAPLCIDVYRVFSVDS